MYLTLRKEREREKKKDIDLFRVTKVKNKTKPEPARVTRHKVERDLIKSDQHLRLFQRLKTARGRFDL